MSVFGKILGKLGFPTAAASTSTTPAPKAAPRTAPTKSAAPSARPTPTPTPRPVPAASPAVAAAPTAPQAPHAYTTVDVTKQLTERAAANPQKLNWQTSIVDLLKLLDLDSSLSERKELATELGCPPELMADSAKMNMWLHKAVLRKLAENGGNVPKELMD